MKIAIVERERREGGGGREMKREEGERDRERVERASEREIEQTKSIEKATKERCIKEGVEGESHAWRNITVF